MVSILDNDKTNLNNFINEVKKIVERFFTNEKNLKICLMMTLIK